MDRRMMAGVVALALAGPAPALAMQMRDPSAAGRVDFTPLDPIDDRINAGEPAANASGRATPAEAAAPAPAPGRSGGLFRWFGRRKAASTPPAAPIARGARTAHAAKVDPATVPSRLTWDDSGQVPAGMAGTAAAGEGSAANLQSVPGQSGRPAPYATQAPDSPRPQRAGPPVDPDDGTDLPGRPAPYRTDPARPARQRAATVAPTSRPRPQAPARAEARPAGPTAPEIPASLPAADPAEPPGPPSAGTGEALPEPPPTVEAAADRQGTATTTAPDPLGPSQPSLPGAGPDAPQALPPLDAMPAAPAPEAAAGPAEPATPPEDGDVRRTSGDASSLKIDAGPSEKPRPYASARAAVVGDEVITVREVEALVREKYQEHVGSQPIDDAERRELIDTLGAMALEFLIEQRLVIQEANHLMRGKDKVRQKFDEFVAQHWREDRLPGLLRKYSAANEYELKRKLAEAGGRTYADLQQEYHDNMSEQAFLSDKIKNRVVADLSQQRAYYNRHLHEFDQPARISWREIEVAVAKYPDRAAARAKAEAILARLRKEDFAAVAASSSDGPTAGQGGLYANMTPGSYGIAPVNAVLGEIPAGRISGLIEAPGSFHIVRVESRREAGPLPFDEVQKKVADLVLERNAMQARKEYIAKLRARTLVRVMPEFAQALAAQERRRQQDDDAAVRPASAR